MWSRLSLCTTLVLLAGCAEPTSSDTVVAAGETSEVAASSPNAAVGGAPSDQPAAGDASAPEPATPSAGGSNQAINETGGSGGGIPMVEVGGDASVEHATSGAKQLTLRGGPSTSADNLGSFSYGYVIECQDLRRDDAWCRIRAEMLDREIVGWAKRRHLTYVGNVWDQEDGVRLFGDPGVWGSADGFPVDARWDIQADDGYANVRATPAADGALVRRLDNRTMTDVERCDGGAPGKRWCEISSPVSGWVHQSGFHRDLRSL